MALSANSSGNQDGTHNPSSFNGGGNPSNIGSAPENSNSAHTLKHNPGLAVEWSSDEQLILDEGLSKYASESKIVRYAKIAMELQEKTVRDVALRCRWMTKKELGKRRKEDHMARKSKDKKEKVTDPSVKPSTHSAARPSVPPYGLPMIPIDNDDVISYKAIGGAKGRLLEQNAHIFNQISANLSVFQIQENLNLFCQTRDNILSILNDMNDMPGIMNQMPPLPVKMNEELANSILPRTYVPMQS